MADLDGIDVRISTEGASAEDVAAVLWAWLRAHGLV
jgi:hypothetical protein